MKTRLRDVMRGELLAMVAVVDKLNSQIDDATKNGCADMTHAELDEAKRDATRIGLQVTKLVADLANPKPLASLKAVR